MFFLVAHLPLNVLLNSLITFLNINFFHKNVFAISEVHRVVKEPAVVSKRNAIKNLINGKRRKSAVNIQTTKTKGTENSIYI